MDSRTIIWDDLVSRGIEKPRSTEYGTFEHLVGDVSHDSLVRRETVIKAEQAPIHPKLLAQYGCDIVGCGTKQKTPLGHSPHHDVQSTISSSSIDHQHISYCAHKSASGSLENRVPSEVCPVPTFNQKANALLF